MKYKVTTSFKIYDDYTIKYAIYRAAHYNNCSSVYYVELEEWKKWLYFLGRRKYKISEI